MKKVFYLTCAGIAALFMLAGCGKKSGDGESRSFVMTTVVYPDEIALWKDGKDEFEGKMVGSGLTVYPGTVLDAVVENGAVLEKTGIRASDGESREYVKVYFNDADFWVQKNLVMVNSYCAMVTSYDSQVLYEKPASDGMMSVEVPSSALVAVSCEAETNGYRKVSYWSTDAKGNPSTSYSGKFLKSSAFETLDYPCESILIKQLSRRGDFSKLSDSLMEIVSVINKTNRTFDVFSSEIASSTALYVLQDNCSLWTLNESGNLVYKKSVPEGTVLEEDGSGSFVCNYESGGKVQSQKLTVITVKYEGESYYVMKNKVAKGALAYAATDIFYLDNQELYSFSTSCIPEKTLVVVACLKDVNWLDEKNSLRLYTTYYYNKSKNMVSKVYAFGSKFGKLHSFIMDKESLAGISLYKKALVQKTDKLRYEMLKNVQLDKVSPFVADWVNEAAGNSLYQGSKVAYAADEFAKQLEQEAKDQKSDSSSYEESYYDYSDDMDDETDDYSYDDDSYDYYSDDDSVDDGSYDDSDDDDSDDYYYSNYVANNPENGEGGYEEDEELSSDGYESEDDDYSYDYE